MTTTQQSIWDTVAAAEGQVSLLQRDIAADRIAHAYLFSGVAGRLPIDVAVAFAAALVCPDGGCGRCDGCLRVSHRAHPDVEVIEPAGMQLLVEQVRDAIRSASRKPVAGSRRVIVVDGSDRMNPNSQNAFLKMLEEPPASTTIVLLAPAPEALLDTVRSRCREVTFRQPPPADVAVILERQGVDPEVARTAARVGGDLQRATTLALDESAREMRTQVVDLAIRPMHDPGDAIEAAEWLAAQTRDIREHVADVHRAEREAFKDWKSETKTDADQRLRREQRRAEQDALEASIDDIASVLRDLLVLVRDPSADLLNAEQCDALTQRAAGLRPGAEARIIGALGEIERSRRRLRGNANVLLTLEEVFLSLYKVW